MAFEDPAEPPSASVLTPNESWADAGRTADLSRYGRRHLTRQHLLADRWLTPVLVVLVVAQTVAMLTSLAAPTVLRDVVQLSASAAMLVTLIVALAWGHWTDRLSFSGTPNIRSALPAGAWPLVRQQLAGRAPADADHLETIVELTYQQRYRQRGQLGLFSWYLPLYVHLGTDTEFTGSWVLLVLGGLGLGTAVVFIVIDDRRLTRFLHQHADFA